MRKKTLIGGIAALALTVIPGLAVANATVVADNGPVRDYIVVLKDGATGAKVSAAKAAAKRLGADVGHSYSAALSGFSASLSTTAASGLRARSDVAYVVRDGKVSITATQSPTPSWGLDRIDQRALPLDDTYNYNVTGDNVTAYVIDTGIRTSHTDFGGRASWGTNTTGDGSDFDCHGHGTHVAGTVGGSSYGVAKTVNLVAVKVLDCSGSGTYAGVIAGVDWVTQHASGPAVANMSLGGGKNQALNKAVTNSIRAGVTYAVASGNSNANACRFSPASTKAAITVNATDDDDSRSSFSNYGRCTDIFAPGRGITSAWSSSDTATNTISGTSMATPHVAGAAALYLDNNPSASPRQVASALVNGGTQDVVSDAGRHSPNVLLYSLV